MILITTYNRTDLLKDLLTQIEEQGYRDDMLILDDGTEQELDLPPHSYNIMIIKFPSNHGKKRYYEVISKGFKELKNRSFDYMWQLPDDISLRPNFFTESKRIYESIQDGNKVCLSTGHDGHRHLKPCWTGFKPKVMGEYVQTQFNDLLYIAERKMFEVLDWDIDKISDERWSVEKNLGSGVGANISRRLDKAGCSMYHVMNTLVDFKWVKSVMQ